MTICGYATNMRYVHIYILYIAVGSVCIVDRDFYVQICVYIYIYIHNYIHIQIQYTSFGYLI